MKKVTLIIFLVILTSACALPGFGNKTGPQPMTPALTLPPSATEVPVPTERPSAVETSQTQSSTIPADENAVLNEIQQQVIELRGLKPKVKELKQDTLTPSELADNVKNDFFKDYTSEDSQADVRELAAFGLLPRSFDLYKLYTDLYSEQVAGYYDPKTKDMYVVQDDQFSGNEKMTYAHEYTHVLQDQTWDLENGLKTNDDYCKTHSEYCAGVQALVEGDASLSEQYWFFQDATEQDQKDVQDFYRTYTSPVFDSTPLFLQKDFIFPYDQGLSFVQYLYDGGGWAAVDKAYENPPSSTEMILHPEKYPSDKQVDVPLKEVTTALGKGWDETTRNSMGEWYLNLILSAGVQESARLDEETASTAAAGWGGDTYTVNWNESTGQLAVILRSRWDSTRDADEFWKALSEYGQKRWGNPGARSNDSLTWENTADHFVRIYRDGGDIWWIIAPDQASAEKMASAAK
jgi:hypothetical protein